MKLIFPSRKCMVSERSRDAKAIEQRQILKHIGVVGEQEEKNYQEMAEAVKQLLEELRE